MCETLFSLIQVKLTLNKAYHNNYYRTLDKIKHGPNCKKSTHQQHMGMVATSNEGSE